MLVKDFQQILGDFTDKMVKGVGTSSGKGNAISHAKMYIDTNNGRLSEVLKIEVHENTLIGAQESLRFVIKIKPEIKSKVII